MKVSRSVTTALQGVALLRAVTHLSGLFLLDKRDIFFSSLRKSETKCR